MGEDVQPAKIDETRTLATDDEGKAVEGDAGDEGDETTPAAAEDEETDANAEGENA